MHPILLSAMRDRCLGDAAKTVLSYLYGRTNGTLTGAVFIDEICADLGIAESTLRRRRSELTSYLASDRTGDILAFTLHECAESAHSSFECAEFTQSERANSAHIDDERAESAQCECADSAQSADQRAESAHSERAESAHSLPRAKRENTPQPPHTPLQGIVNNTAAAGLTSTSSRGSAEGAERAAALLVAAGIETDKALELARQYGLEASARHVAAWQLAKGHMRLGVGALIHRLTKWPVPPVAAADMTAGILAEHITRDDLLRWGLARDPLAAYDVPPGFDGIVKH